MSATHSQYRDRLFTFIFGSPEHPDWTLSLYNAINGTSYDDPGQITFTTIREVLYLGMHNDVSFLLADEMNLYEQQSTYNPNMPLRMLQYAGQLYEKHISERKYNKFGKKLIPLPAPRLIVFYNGLDEMPIEVNLTLQDSFPAGSRSDIEVHVHMVNINSGYNPTLMHACKPLHEYVWTVERIRGNMAYMDRESAIDEAIEAMPDSFVIKPYLKAHKAEVKDMLLTEYNEAEAMELFREEGREESLLENLTSLMETISCTAERAMDLLRVPAEKRPRLLSQLQASDL